jgi:hypothetical protein
MALDSSLVFKGEHGEVWSDGVWLTNFYQVEFTADISYDDIKRAGSRTMGNKAGTIKYSGTITGYKISNDLARKVAQVTNDKLGAFVSELICKIYNPDTGVTERVRIKGVQFSKIDIMKFDHGAVVETEWPFLADGYEYL